MPKYRTVKWNDYKVSLKPKGWRAVMHFLPYLSGTDVRLTLSIQTQSGEPREFDCELFCHHYDGQRWTYMHNLSGVISPDTTPTAELKVDRQQYLVTYGEYVVSIKIREHDESSGLLAIGNFSILERDKIIPYVVFSIISLVIGAGLLLFFQRLLNP